LYRFWSSLSSGASICIRFVDTVWRRKNGIVTARTTSVSRMIEIAMLPVTWSKKTRMMKNSWKIGVNSHAMNPKRLSGWAGASGIAAGGRLGVGVGPGVVPGAGVGAGKQAATTSSTSRPTATGPNQAGSHRPRRVTLEIFKEPGRIRRDSPGDTVRCVSFPSNCP
jgi:hypothetical protein